MKTKLIVLAFVSVAALSGYGWAQKGHDVTAAIAEVHLTDAAKAAVDSIFDGKSLVYWSNWMDNASHRPEYAYTSTWHYKNINQDQRYEEAPVHPDGNIETALASLIASLESGDLTKEQSAEALRMVVHLVGDLHQPMHLGRQTDLGGNRTKVKFFGRDNNLHAVWDASIVESAHKWSYTEWVDQIDRESEESVASIVEGTIVDWGRETYVIALDVYGSTPEGYNISYDYVADWTPVIERQFLKGGLRLAQILNNIYK